MKKNRNTLSEQLKALILNANMSRYRIAKITGLTEAGLSRFVNGISGLSLDSIDKISDCLDLEITTRKPTEKKGNN